MNGSIERPVNTFMDAMRSQPLSLALVVMNFCLLGYLYYGAIVATNERRIEMNLLYENRKYVTDMLASCVHVNDLDKILGRKQ